MTTPVRVRYAPSPTGFLHIGGLRTALYNYLFARHHHGTFVLRVEDTDRSRYVEGAVEDFIHMLTWAGIEIDEGPGKDGGHGPYYQSQRLDLYVQHVQKLLSDGNAYRCFCTADRLDQMRKFQEKSKVPPKYDRTCLRLSQDDVSRKMEAGEPFTIRMKVPDNTVVQFKDLIRGDVEFSSFNIDDQVLMKSDGYPTYHLANVVDDHWMEISHVIRGEEWVSSTPKHVLLYRYFGWSIPQFAHLPLLLNEDRSKMSKRQGDVEARAYPPKGYLAEGLVNFIALLGWNPGDEREIFSMDELIREFSIERIHKAGAVFNVEKLNWLNTQHIRRKSNEEILRRLQPDLKAAGFDHFSDDYVMRVIELMKERINFIHEITTFSDYFFRTTLDYDKDLDVIRKRWKPESEGHVKELAVRLAQLDPFTKETIETTFHTYAGEKNVKIGELVHPIRYALSGRTLGPGLYEMMDVLGKTRVNERLQEATFKKIIQAIGQPV